MSEGTSNPVLDELWRQQRIWSTAANRAKKSVNRSLMAVLVLAVAGAVFGALSAQLASTSSAASRGLAFAAAVIVALIPLARRGSGATHAWIRMRSVSEALKADVYLFLARGGPFRGEDRLQKLRGRGDTLVNDVADLDWRVMDVVPDDKPLPDVHDLDSYLAIRVDQQITGYYRPKALEMRRNLRTLQRLQIALSFLGAVLAAAAAAFQVGSVSIWIGVATTVAAALTAHLAAGRYEYQLLEYSRTASALERLRKRYREDPAGQDPADFMARCEEIISVQNEAWMAKWSTPDDPGDGS